MTVITRNEAANIDACLAAVSWADEVLVVDSGSTDDTVERARGAGARVLVHDFHSYSAQKNFAASVASHDWILSVDADERVTPELGAEIRRLLAADPTAGRLSCAARRVASRPVDPHDRLVSGLPAAALRSSPCPVERAPRSRVRAGGGANRDDDPRAATLRLPRSQPSRRDDGSVHDAGRRGDVRRRAGTRASPICCCIRPRHFCATTFCEGAWPTACPASSSRR